MVAQAIADRLLAGDRGGRTVIGNGRTEIAGKLSVPMTSNRWTCRKVHAFACPMRARSLICELACR
jgi:hypothetical protein